MIVKCTSCGWQGDDSKLVVKYLHNPEMPGDVVPEPVCPICGNFWVEEVEG